MPKPDLESLDQHEIRSVAAQLRSRLKARDFLDGLNANAADELEALQGLLATAKTHGVGCDDLHPALAGYKPAKPPPATPAAQVSTSKAAPSAPAQVLPAGSYLAQNLTALCTGK